MTRFADELFDDLMREHGSTLAQTRVPTAAKRHPAARPVLMAAGAGGLAIAATVGSLVATGGGTPAYAMTTHPDGTVTLAVYKQSGIPQVNAKLHALGDRVVVVPVEANCPSITSLPAPAVPASQISVQASGSVSGGVTVAAQGVPVGDILVLGVQQTAGGQFSMQQAITSTGGHASGTGSAQAAGQPPVVAGSSRLTSGPAPSCVSIPPAPAGGPGPVRGSGDKPVKVHGSSGGQGTVTRGGGGSGPATSSNG